jgi:hypothetical protein
MSDSAMITLAAAAHCLRCEWTASGTMAEADRGAEKHTKAGHPTATTAEPATTTTGGQRS